MKLSNIKYFIELSSRFGFRDAWQIQHKLFSKSKYKNTLTELNINQLGDSIFLRADSSDTNTFNQVFVFDEYEFLLDFVPKTIIDGGANIGFASRFLSKKFPEAVIIAVEPESSNFEILKKNISSFKNINAIQTGIWSSDATLKIKNKEAEPWAFEVIETNENDVEGFRATSIESIMKSNHWETIDLLKLDIEGSEKAVFSKNIDFWLPRTRAIVIELHDWMELGCSKVFFNAIKDYDYKVALSGENIILQRTDF